MEDRTTASSHVGPDKRRRTKAKLLSWLIVGLAFVFLLGVMFFWLAQALPYIALAQIGELLNARIDVSTVDLSLNGGVHIENLFVRPAEQQQAGATILKAETVDARFGIGSLLLLNPQLKEVRVSEFVFDVQHNLDTGRWNVAALEIKMPTDGSEEIPQVELSEGTLQYSKVSAGKAKVAASVPINARFQYDDEEKGYNFELTTAQLSGGFGESHLRGRWRPGSITIAGGVSSTDAPSLDRAWAIDVLAAGLTYDQQNNYSLELRIKDFHSSHISQSQAAAFIEPQSLAKLSALEILQQLFSQYRPAGTVDMELNASGNLDRLEDSSLSGTIACKDVSLCHPKYPYTVESLTGQIAFTEDRIALHNLVGRHGDVNVTIEGLLENLSPTPQYQVRIMSDNMILDADLYDALRPGQKRLWDAFAPGGRAVLDYRISRDSDADSKKTLTVELLDVEATYRSFPYPLDNLTGELIFHGDDLVISDVKCRMDECEIALEGNVTALSTKRAVYDISIDANNIPLDATLAAALPEAQRRLYNRLNLAGLADAKIKVYTPQQGDVSRTFRADVSLENGSLRLAESELLVSDVSARTVVRPHSIGIEDFAGRYRDGSVSLTGELGLTEQAQPARYHLTVNTKETPLSDELIGLLPARAAEVISGLRPQGRINLDAKFEKQASDEHPDYRLTVDCLSNSATFKRFAYPLRDIRGRLIITDESVVFENVTAAPVSTAAVGAESPTIALGGQMNLGGSVLHDGTFKLSAKNIFSGEQLGVALSEALAPFYESLLPTGFFDLDLESVKVFTAEDGERFVDFTGGVRFKNCGFELSGTEGELDAQLRLRGLYKIGEGLTKGQIGLSADALRIKGKCVENLRANVAYDPALKSWLANDLVADFYGGKLTGKLKFGHDNKKTLDYRFRVAFDDVAVKAFLEDSRSPNAPEKAQTSGTMTGALSVHAQMGDASSRVGRCRFAIDRMQIGKLSPLAKLLYVLNLTEIKDFAFERMVVDSYVKHNTLFFEKLDLSGQAIAFSGSGWMDLQSDEVDLTLAARGQRLAEAEPSVMQSLAEGIGQAVVRVEVTGNVYDPQVTTRTLPVIKDSLEIFGASR
jgi:hypothetical protein